MAPLSECPLLACKGKSRGTPVTKPNLSPRILPDCYSRRILVRHHLSSGQATRTRLRINQSVTSIHFQAKSSLLLPRDQSTTYGVKRNINQHSKRTLRIFHYGFPPNSTVTCLLADSSRRNITALAFSNPPAYGAPYHYLLQRYYLSSIENQQWSGIPYARLTSVLLFSAFLFHAFLFHFIS